MADAILTSLEWALRELRDGARQERYARARRYYGGVHPMMFATDKFRSTFGKSLETVADNLCPAVVDSISDRLAVTGVEADPDAGGSDELANTAWGIWQRNRMDLRASETHHEALLTGDGYALTWPNLAGDAVIWSIPSCDMAVAYDPLQPGALRRAARVWQDDDDLRVHIDIYTVDRVERWVTARPRKSESTLGSRLRARDFLPYAVDAFGNTVAEVEPNPWGVVPVVHFPNVAFHGYGLSELRDVYPLQDALNKTLCDLLVSNEFAAFRQRWATGYDADPPAGAQGTAGNISAYGVDRMMWSSDPATRFGNFDASEAEGFLSTIENFRAEVARVSGTPLHYLFITRGDFPSGEAMKSAEARFVEKIEKRQASFGNQWENLLALAIRQESSSDLELDGAALSMQWKGAEPVGLNTPPAAGPTDAEGRRSSEAPPLAPPAA